MSAARILRRLRAKADLVEHYSHIARDKVAKGTTRNVASERVDA
jgi:hypothetical protein